jgi:peptidoglycan/LPS O-acetylase OafA/YrhL
LLVNIQCLRLVAAALVLLYHTEAWIRLDSGFAAPLFAFGQAAGFAGVDVFFVISGFIMAHTTLAAQGGVAAGEFARRRAARIYSGYWPFFALTLVVFAWARPEHFAESDLWKSFWLWPQPLNRNLLELSWTL